MKKINYLKYDVVVVGGGTSGCACAYECAKLKLKTLLVEKNNFLGGLMTGGLVVPVMKSSVEDLNCEYYSKLVETAKKYNAQGTYIDSNDGWFNPELMKIVLDDVLTTPDIKENLDILFETEVFDVLKNDDSVSKIILKSKILSIPIEAKAFVDATGSGEFSYLCGANFQKDTTQKQQNTLRFILGNVDIEKFCDFLETLEDSWDITNTNRNDRNSNKNIKKQIHFTTASTWDENKTWKLDKILKEGVKEGLLKEQDRSYFQIFSVAGAPNCVAFNCPRINNYSSDQFLASRELIEARKAIWRLLGFVKAKFKGFEEAIIVEIAPITGIREENRIVSKEIFKKEDIMAQKKAKTPILKANYGIDIHSNKKNNSKLEETPSYELPLESLMSLDIKNLFAIGKVLGADFEAHSALRVQKSVMSMGEGLAKYLRKIIL